MSRVDDGQLSDGQVRLRTLQSRDYEHLYSLLAFPEISLHTRSRGTTPSPEEFRRAMWSNVFVLFAVEDIQRRELLGVTSSYNVSHRNGTGYLAVTGTLEALRSGGLLRGAALLIDYLFDNWPFRKLYFESPEHSFASFRSGLGTVFVEEGRLKQFEFRAGEYSDVVVCSISRSSWQLLRQPTERTSASAARLALGSDRSGVSLRSSDSDPLPLTCSIDEFAEMVSEVLGTKIDDVTQRLDLDSLHILELGAVIEELSGVVVPQIKEGEMESVVTLYQLYCTHSSMPTTARHLD